MGGGGGRVMMRVNQGDRELPEWGGGGEEGRACGGGGGRVMMGVNQGDRELPEWGGRRGGHVGGGGRQGHDGSEPG